MKRQGFLRRIPCYRAELLRKARIRKLKGHFERYIRKIEDDFGTMTKDRFQAAIWKIAAYRRLIESLERLL